MNASKTFNRCLRLAVAIVLLQMQACNYDSSRKYTRVADSVVATRKDDTVKPPKPENSINGTYKQYSFKGGNWRDTVFDTQKLLEIRDSVLLFLKDGKVVDFDTLSVYIPKNGYPRLYRKRIERVDLRFRLNFDTMIMIDRSEPGWVAEFSRVK